MPIVKLTDAKTLPLPEAVLQAVGLKPGDAVAIEAGDDGTIIVRPAPTPESTAAVVAVSLQQSIHRKNLETPVQSIRGVGPKLAENQAKKVVVVVEDALFLLPHRYEDRRTLSKIAKLRPGAHEVFFAEVIACETK